jgi:hypothetical protein
MKYQGRQCIFIEFFGCIYTAAPSSKEDTEVVSESGNRLNGRSVYEFNGLVQYRLLAVLLDGTPLLGVRVKKMLYYWNRGHSVAAPRCPS